MNQQANNPLKADKLPPGRKKNAVMPADMNLFDDRVPPRQQPKTATDDEEDMFGNLVRRVAKNQR